RRADVASEAGPGWEVDRRRPDEATRGNLDGLARLAGAGGRCRRAARRLAAGRRVRAALQLRQQQPGPAREGGAHARARFAQPGRLGCGGADLRRAGGRGAAARDPQLRFRVRVMAEKIDNTQPDGPLYATDRPGVDKAKLHAEMLARHKEAADFWEPMFRLARDDMEFAFLPDSQWDEWMAQTRKGRPSYTVNKVRQAMKQITNDQRQNRPQAKVRAVEDGDADLAEVRQGIIRNIDAQLDAQRA